MSVVNQHQPDAPLTQPAWLPKGAQRHPTAQCYISSPGMRRDILSQPVLRPAPFTRDGSQPVLQAIESDVPNPVEDEVIDRSYAHLNLPREGQTLGSSFKLFYINGTVFDRKVKIVFRAKDGQDFEVDETFIMDGNRVEQMIARPELPAGHYDVIVKLENSTDNFVQSASTSVVIA